MKKIFLFLLLSSVFSNAQIKTDKTAIENVLDTWHEAAAQANFDAYFFLMTKDAVFIGTDATENWQLDAFKAFSKPYFDKGKAWDFKPVERNIYFSDDGKIAWFDELLDTHMEICRGSGVLKKEKNQWKIAHYVLSITIPNDNIDAVIKLKQEFDDKLLESLKVKK